jgi:hypothetical protein
MSSQRYTGGFDGLFNLGIFKTLDGRGSRASIVLRSLLS